MKSLNFIIPLRIYPFDVMVSICEDDEKLKKRLLRHGIPDCEIKIKAPDNIETEQGRCTMFKGNETLIRIYKYPETPAEFGHLQHEIFHAACFVLLKIGMKLSYKSDEAYAYLIDYLTTEIYKRLWK